MEKAGTREQQNKIINLDYLKQRTKTNPELMMEMISIYLKQTPLLVSEMKRSLQDNNRDILCAAVHKMVPSFSIMGISTAYETIAKKVQEYAGTQQHKAAIPGLVLQLENICAQACIELKEAYDLINNKDL